MKATLLQICSYYIGSKLYSELFVELEKKGYIQEVFIPVHQDRLLNANRIDGQESLHLHYSKNFKSMDRLFYYTKVDKIYRDMVKKMDFEPIEVAHAHSLFINGGVAQRLKESHNIPYVVEVQNTDINVFWRYMVHLRRQGMKILRDADRIVFYSPAYREYLLEELTPMKLRESFRQKSIVIGSGANPFWFEHMGQKKAMAKDGPIRLIFVGLVDKNKNAEATVMACDLLREKGYDVAYTVVGQITHPRYDKLFSDRKYIRYIPHSPKEELLEHLRASDIFVMPSRYDTFGLVYVEAMTQGLPIIYSKGQGFDGQEPDGEIGMAVRYDSPEEIADAILRIRDRYEPMSERAIEVSKRFTWDRITDKYDQMYQELLKARSL